MGEAIKEAYNKANAAAAKIIGLAREYPYATAAISLVLAIGILVILAPATVHLLGFSAVGPVEDKSSGF